MLEKIQEGIGHSKIAYSDTLHNLEVISDDIHRSRQEKARHQRMMGQRGEGVGAEHNDARNSIPHDKSMDRIRRVSLDQLLDEDQRGSLGDDDATTTGSISSDEDSASGNEIGNNRPVSVMSGEVVVGVKMNPAIPSICVKNENNNDVGCDREAGLFGPGCDNDDSNKNSENHDWNDNLQKAMLVKETDRTIKEKVESIDSSYDIITSHSIKPLSPDAIDLLPSFDFTDSGRRLLNELNQKRRTRSMVDLTSLSASESEMVKGNIVDISKSSDSTDDLNRDIADDDEACGRERYQSLPRSRKSSSFSIGVKPEGYNTPRDTPESRRRNIAMLAALTIPSLLAVAHQENNVNGSS